MRSTSIPALLFAAGACAAQPRLSADHLRGSLPRENRLRTANVPRPSESAVTICLVTDPDHLIVDAAETLASRMFASIRVRLRWYGPPACPAGAGDPVVLMLETSTPAADHRGALGVALPREGSAWVFYDRVRQSYRGNKYVAALLAHVMAHEIAHVLQGINRHSKSGILKARWSDSDCARMTLAPLMFTREDALLIHRGLEERHSRLPGHSPEFLINARRQPVQCLLVSSRPSPQEPSGLRALGVDRSALYSPKKISSPVLAFRPISHLPD